MKREVKELFKQHVDQHEFVVDPNEIWANVEPRINTKNDRRSIFVPLSLLVLTSISFVLIQWKLNAYFDTNIVNDKITFKYAEKEQKPDVNQKYSTSNSKEAFSNSNQNSTISKTNTDIYNLNQNEDNAYGTALSFKNLPGSNNVQQSVKEAHQVTDLLDQKTEGQTSVNSKNAQSALAYPDKLSLASNLNTLPVAPQAITPMRTLPLLNNLLDGFTTNLGMPQLAKRIQVKNKRHSFFEIWGGYATIENNFITEDALHNNQLKTFLNESEAYQMGFNWGFGLMKSLQIYGGLKFERAFDQIGWSGEYLQDSNGEPIPISGVENNGTPIYNFGESNYFERVEVNLSGYNQFDVLDGLIGLNWLLHKSQFSFGIYGELGVPLWHRESGYFLNAHLAPIDLSVSEELSYAPEIRMGTNITYNVSAYWQIGARVGFSERTLNYTDAAVQRRSLQTSLMLKTQF